ACLRVRTGPNRPPPMNTLCAAFGKDPRYIWVSRHRGGFGYNLGYPLWQLAIYDRQTGRLFTQTDMYGSAMRPVLSSDGKWLVYATRYDAETGLRLRNLDRKSTRLNSSHVSISYAVFCLKKKNKTQQTQPPSQ